MTKQLTAEIAGAGFAGLTLATALAQRGWKVRVHERSPEVRAFGAGIWIYENGIHVLNSIGAADEAFRDRPVASEFVNWDAKGRVVHRTAYGALDSRTENRVFIVTRQRLLMAIYHAALRAGVQVVGNSKVVGAEPQGVLITESGERIQADLVVGADGVHSRVRDSLGLLKKRTRNRDGAFRLLLPQLPGRRDTWNDEILRGWWSGPRRALYNPCEDEKIYLCFTSPAHQVDPLNPQLDKASWKSSFPNLAPLIDRIGDDVRYDAFVTTELHRWSRGRVAIIGDAAHSMVPGLGQGCGRSLVNAVSLAGMLQSSGDIPLVLDHWEQATRPITEHTQFWSSFAWPKSRWPATATRMFFNFPLWADWVHRQKTVPVISLPVGADERARWYPPRHTAETASAEGSSSLMAQ